MKKDFDIHQWQAKFLRRSLNEEQQVVKQFTFGYDLQNIREVEDYVADNYEEGVDFTMHVGRGDDVMNALDILNNGMLKDGELLSLVRACKGGGSFIER